MKTALQELIDFLELELKMGDFLQLPAYEKAKSLLEKEKQQIIDAYKEGWKNPSKFREHGSPYYYQKTFGDNP
jgi:hypothetical protein